MYPSDALQPIQRRRTSMDFLLEKSILKAWQLKSVINGSLRQSRSLHRCSQDGPLITCLLWTYIDVTRYIGPSFAVRLRPLHLPHFKLRIITRTRCPSASPKENCADRRGVPRHRRGVVRHQQIYRTQNGNNSTVCDIVLLNRLPQGLRQMRRV